ncbi:MAG: hypothetical protein AB8F94_20945 [Saprospiraceae bacterium]
MDKKTICLLLLFMFSNCNFSKKTAGLKSNKDHPTFLETDHFGIRVKPILNREYLIFLSWYISVYGESYPEKVINILPKKSLDPRYGSNFEMNDILNASTSILKNYIFNPKYIDYPLIGLSSSQILEMEKWMSDRFNENALIEKKNLNFNPEQKDEDCFTLETLLVQQYEGSVRKAFSNRVWRKEYLANFRLPYQKEIDLIKNHPNFYTQLKEYPFNKKDFLWKWNKYYLAISPNKNTIILKHSIYSIELIYENGFENNNTFTDATLKDKSLEFSNKKYLDLGNPDGAKDQYENKYPYLEKNRSGQMQFVIVGIDDKNRPIVADPIQLKNEGPLENKIFRIAFNKTLESQHLPK